VRDSDLDNISLLEPGGTRHLGRDATWRARHDDRSLAQRSSPRTVRDNVSDVEDHVRNWGLLPDLAVDLGGQV
jgi:hypothetical protein